MKDHVDLVLDRWQDDGEFDDRTAVEIFTRMSLLVRAVGADKAQAVRAIGLPMWVIETLYALRRQGSPYLASPTELAVELGVTQAAMTARVRSLVRRGFVTRRPDPIDGRRILVGLSARGHRLTDRVFTLQAGAESAHLAALRPAQRRQLADLLRRL